MATSWAVPHHGIDGCKGVGKGKTLRNHTLCGRGNTGTSSKHAIYGHMWEGKRGVSETMLHMGRSRKGFPVSTPYVIYGDNARYSEVNAIAFYQNQTLLELAAVGFLIFKLPPHLVMNGMETHSGCSCTPLNWFHLKKVPCSRNLAKIRLLY